MIKPTAPQDSSCSAHPPQMSSFVRTRAGTSRRSFGKVFRTDCKFSGKTPDADIFNRFVAQMTQRSKEEGCAFFFYLFFFMERFQKISMEALFLILKIHLTTDVFRQQSVSETH